MRWSGSHSVGFPWGNPVFSHKITTRTQTSVPTSMINVSDVCYMFCNRCKMDTGNGSSLCFHICSTAAYAYTLSTVFSLQFR